MTNTKSTRIFYSEERRVTIFLREIKSGKRRYLNIIETYYDNGKVRHRSIASLGRVDNLLNSEQLRRIAVSLLSYCKKNKTHFDISTAEEKERRIWGAPAVVRKIWDMFGLDNLLLDITDGYNIRFDLFSCVFLMVLDRLCHPVSKKRSYDEQDKYCGIKEIQLHHLYRALDILAENKEGIENYLFDTNRSLFNAKVDVVFYDVTTLYFESVISDRIRDFGFSKEQKINEVQIVLGLLVDEEGRPIGFDLFAGNIFEGKTIKQTLEKMRDRFQIKRVVIVGDRGMLSEENLQLIERLGYEYVVGSRLRNKAKRLKEEVLETSSYIEIKTAEEGEIFRYKEITTGNNKIICAFSSKRAEKDREDRYRLIEKAEDLLQRGREIITKRGAMRYIKIKTVGTREIDEEKIKEDEMWDGYYGIETNSKGMSAELIIKIYHDLWKVEEAFRVLKSHLETRPIFHWTEKRIKGHLVLCFISFLLERTLELELKKGKIEHSPQKIRDALNKLQVSKVEIEGERFYIRSAVEGDGNNILRGLKIKIPAKIMREEEFRDLITKDYRLDLVS